MGRMNMILVGCLLSLASSVQAAVKFEIAPVNGGLSGLRRAEPAIQPAFEPDGVGGYRRVVGQSKVLRNVVYSWSPAISTGLIVRFVSDDVKPGFGLGGHFVAFKEGEEVRTAPSITAHYGTKDKQLFFGFLFTATDDVRLPNGRNEIVVADDEANSFVTRHTSDRLNFFGGVVIATLP